MTLLRAAGHLAGRFALELALLAVIAYLALREPVFFTPQNFLTILRSVSEQGLIAFGMTAVIIVGEIDLSVGAIVAFSGCLTATLTQRGWPIPGGILCSLLAGGLVGAFSGLVRSRFLVPTFITSLALYTGLRGLALELTQGFPISPFPEWYQSLGGGHLGGLPVPALILAVAFVTFHLMLTRTAFGRAIYATGGNAEAARLSGIRVHRVRTATLAITGCLAAWSGVMLSSRLMSGTPTVGVGWELDAIAAVIVGGTSFAGGIGSVWGTLVGLFFIGVIANGMTLTNTPDFRQYIVKGLLIFGAVLLNRLQQRTR